jgi:acyl-coenzyme A synthetase/AMP-(fatty) acid ligase
MNHYPGFYFTGDGASRDKDGFIWIRGRVEYVFPCCFILMMRFSKL